MEKTLWIIITILTITSCTDEQPLKEFYSSKVLECYKVYDSLKLNDTTFKQDYTEYVGNCLEGSYFEDVSFITIDGDSIVFGNIDKPIFLQAFASWCNPCVAEIPALNDVIDKYSDKIVFIGLSWDKTEKLSDIRDRYNPKFNLVASPKEQSLDNRVLIDLPGFKQMLPFPTTYYITMDKEIHKITCGGQVSSYYTYEGDSMTEVKIQSKEELYASVFSNFSSNLDTLLTIKSHKQLLKQQALIGSLFSCNTLALTLK